MLFGITKKIKKSNLFKILLLYLFSEIILIFVDLARKAKLEYVF